MRLFQAEHSPLKRDEIAADTRHLLLQHMPKGAQLRLADVLELFRLMRRTNQGASAATTSVSPSERSSPDKPWASTSMKKARERDMLAGLGAPEIEKGQPDQPPTSRRMEPPAEPKLPAQIFSRFWKIDIPPICSRFWNILSDRKQANRPDTPTKKPTANITADQSNSAKGIPTEWTQTSSRRSKS